MRSFIAIDLPNEVKKELKQVQEKLPKENCKLLLVNPDILHLTLRFLGEISENELFKVKEAIEKIKFQKFEAHISNVGFFPDENFIRVVWVSLEPSDKFKEIHNTLDSELKKIGINKNERFESHVTLARVKFVKDKKFFVEQIKKIPLKSIQFVVDEIKLKKSTLTPNGPVYEDLNLDQ
ncbi:RNA 2',3'-cyclic phosphodiesterase [Candidatus Pacearchaeota archaeon CG06_land_8_20_14_3_00_35_12]|nr:MAG: RNA 2',3'-cyclic phosphodiesterase [Candidatus Pacearchaeota archaeon CG06_land_8_20_14_3_00_35_12]